MPILQITMRLDCASVIQKTNKQTNKLDAEIDIREIIIIPLRIVTQSQTHGPPHTTISK